MAKKNEEVIFIVRCRLEVRDKNLRNNYIVSMKEALRGIAIYGSNEISVKSIKRIIPAPAKKGKSHGM